MTPSRATWVLACAGFLACAGSTGGGQDEPLHKVAVRGTSIVDGTTGAPVTLQGISMASGVWQWDFNAPDAGALDTVQYMQDEADFAQVHGWGANAVTLYINWYWFQEPAGWEWLDRTFEWCSRYHLYVIPSMVVYPVGGQRGGAAFWASQQAQDDLQAFWVEFARRYKGRAEVVGADVLNEPQGANPGVYAAYQAKLIDAMRAEDPDLVVFIEGEWGHLGQIVDRPNLIYVDHYYEPFYLTAAGFPWIENGDVPDDTSYPGDMVVSKQWLDADTWYDSGSTDAGWRTVELPATTVPYPQHPDVDLPADVAGVGFYTTGGMQSSEVDLDAVEFSILRKSGPSTWSAWAPAPDGGFESGGGTQAPYWNFTHDEATSSAQRVQGAAAEGSWFAAMKGCVAGCWIGMWTDWVGTLGMIPVAPGDQLRLRYRTRFQNMTGATMWARIDFGRRNFEHWDKSKLRTSVQTRMVQFSEQHQVPLLVGEFTPSLSGKRPDGLTYLNDLIDVFQEAGLHWTYYVYRENWPAERRYLGIYNCPPGVRNDGSACVEDTEIRDVVTAHFR